MLYQFDWKNNGTNEKDYRRMYELGYDCLLGDDEMDICRIGSEKVLLTAKQGDKIFVGRDTIELIREIHIKG